MDPVTLILAVPAIVLGVYIAHRLDDWQRRRAIAQIVREYNARQKGRRS